jgi:hypothetical protein
MRVLLLLTWDVTFQLDFGMSVVGTDGENAGMWLMRLEKIYFQNLSPQKGTVKDGARQSRSCSISAGVGARWQCSR